MAGVDDHDEHTVGLDTHIHGEAELLVAYEERQLQIILRSPAGNLLGFEHRAETVEEKLAVKKARSTLITPDALFSINGAECDNTDKSVDMSAVESQDRHKEHHHESNDRHTEIFAQYGFMCSEERISDIRVMLPNTFPGIETLHVQWVTGSQQGVTKLNQHNLKLVFAD